MGVSSSNSTAAGARGGETNIIPQGQTSGDYANDPYIETRQSKSKGTQALKP
jgi:hypothetical protein